MGSATRDRLAMLLAWMMLYKILHTLVVWFRQMGYKRYMESFAWLTGQAEYKGCGRATKETGYMVYGHSYFDRWVASVDRDAR